MDTLAQLAALIQQRNQVESEITAITGRPASIGHLGEHIAAQIFAIDLVESAAHKSLDGYFRSGALAGKSVNVKWYAKREGLLDITPNALPDTYLVMTGPAAAAMSSRGATRPWWIDKVYLFDAATLVAALHRAGVKMGVATSVRQALWQQAMIYPKAANPRLPLNDTQRRLLALFHSNAA